MVTAPPVNREKLHRDWCERHERIQNEVLGLHHHRALWRETRVALLDAEPEGPGFFVSHYSTLYVESQAIRVRRLVRRGDNDPFSLGALIEAARRNPSVLTRDRYIERATRSTNDDADLFANWDRKRAVEEWLRMCGSGNEISPVNLDGYLKRLDRANEIAAHADHHVAHISNPSRTDPGTSATYRDLDEAIDEIGEVHRDWGVILHGRYLAQFEPVVQGDWKAPLRHPLFETFD